MNYQNILSLWGDRENHFHVSLNALSKEAKQELVKTFNEEDKKFQFNEGVFLTEGADCFELFAYGKPVGLLSVKVTTHWHGVKDEEPDEGEEYGAIIMPPNALIEILGVFILSDFRGCGTGSRLASIASEFIAASLINNFEKSEFETFSIQLLCDFDSVEGERFFNEFAHDFEADSCMAGILKANGVSYKLELVAGY